MHIEALSVLLKQYVKKKKGRIRPNMKLCENAAAYWQSSKINIKTKKGKSMKARYLVIWKLRRELSLVPLTPTNHHRKKREQKKMKIRVSILRVFLVLFVIVHVGKRLIEALLGYTANLLVVGAAIFR